jgi:hypothetical protein
MATLATPSYLQQQPWQASQNYLASLPNYFTNTGIGAATRNLNNQTWNSASAIAAAASTRYAQTAQQNGASTLGAGFAQNAAMVPAYQQIAQNNQDLDKLRLQARGQQAQIGAGLSSDIGKLQEGYQSTLSDYFLNQQKLQQQQSQFGQTYGLQQQQLAQQTAYQQGSLALQKAQLALQNNPIKAGFYATNNQGYLTGSTPYSQSIGYNSNILASLGYPGLPFAGSQGNPLQGSPAIQGSYI